METIINYLDNMFVNLPQTHEMIKLKDDLLTTMEEKYLELKREGKSENEAVGIVISEFGNIDELIAELGLKQREAEEPANEIVLSADEAEGYLAARKRTGKLVGSGVVMVLTGVSLLIFITSLAQDGFLGSMFSEEQYSIIGVIVMLLFIAPAIGLFIFSGLTLKKYEYLEDGATLPYTLRTWISQKQSAFAPTYTFSLITAVCLCVLSPVVLFVSTLFGEEVSAYGVVVLLLIIAVAVFLFVYYGNIQGSFTTLLNARPISPEQEKSDRIIGAIAAIVWPLATVTFLVSGLVFHQWHINWIIFPVVGVLFGVFSGAYNILKGNNKS